jgi:hypothetical protein
LEKSFLNLINENHRLHEDDVIAEHMIPNTFNEETEFLSDSNLNSLKRHYRTNMDSVRCDERRQVISSKDIWDGSIDRFEVFRNNAEGHYE